MVRVDDQRIQCNQQCLAAVGLEVQVLFGSGVELGKYRKAQRDNLLLQQLLHDGFDEASGSVQDLGQTAQGREAKHFIAIIGL